MPQDLKVLDGYIRQSDWPHVVCPVCGYGFLTVQFFKEVESAYSKRLKDDDGWEPDLIFGTFYGVLKCAVEKCAETITVEGDFKVAPDRDHNGSWYGQYDSYYRLRFALPALTILTLPTKTPKAVKRAIQGASQVLWIDPSAAANRLRLAIEDLLTDRRIPRYRVTPGKRTRLTTHARIVKFKSLDLKAGEALEAVKWIGNSGSHEDSLTATDVLEGADMLGYALRLLYDKSDQDLRRRIRSVNKSKGLPRKK